ncbi:CatB-related O-acetyltransferase [Rhizobium mongolense]|uniref:Acetyltransferase-like isoleucine patch superfamily enzyme n=2 Tax=Rhizobium mongolense TaxID=57676 RepID=A0ABR6IV34_9HYPH|nr:CatB-related O-acetyltransferase [Rhizobium mongolense]MBB4231773.1 acetyltransferase-like isoleucine patch superfamily enzyme [Rhizobium mongolense]TVZ66735.1 transferase family hexapeptide repeat protein [Rhizobium mongolense USDA 1844]
MPGETSTIAGSATVKVGMLEDPIHVGPACAVTAESIGRYCFVNAGTCIYDGVTIGRFVTFARNCQIGGAEHPIHYVSTSYFRILKSWFPNDPVAQNAAMIPNTWPKDRKRSNKIVIGNDAWFGAASLVLRGVTIGDGAVIGAGAVVTKDVPPYAIVAGNPAKIIRYRFEPQIIEKLLRVRWWDRELDIILKLPLDDVGKTIDILLEEDARKAS